MKTYGWPLVLWVCSLLGLVAMLLVESALADALALLLLCLPLAVLARYALLPTHSRR